MRLNLGGRPKVAVEDGEPIAVYLIARINKQVHSSGDVLGYSVWAEGEIRAGNFENIILGIVSVKWLREGTIRHRCSEKDCQLLLTKEKALTALNMLE